jgi:hypothetical protein
VTREELIKKLKRLSKTQFAKVVPFIEADIETVDKLGAIKAEVQTGRRSATTQRILQAKDVYAWVRQTCSKGS